MKTRIVCMNCTVSFNEFHEYVCMACCNFDIREAIFKIFFRETSPNKQAIKVLYFCFYLFFFVFLVCEQFTHGCYVKAERSGSITRDRFVLAMPTPLP